MITLSNRKSITPHTMLECGADVVVQGKLGKVVSAKVVPAHPCGTIVVHMVELTHKISTSFGRSKVEPIKPVKREVNYSFIEQVL